MTYTGRESSPLGNGISAEGYELDTIMQGCDKIDWIVKYKNNRKVWVRLDKKVNTIVHEEIHEEDANDDKVEDDKIVEEKVEDAKEEVVHANEEVVPTQCVNGNEGKKANNYIKYMSKRRNEMKTDGNAMTAKEAYNTILQEWKELKKDKKKYDEVINTL